MKNMAPGRVIANYGAANPEIVVVYFDIGLL